ncbi:MAG: hypothetical protein AB8C46_22450 [Burkholderiaceae bacterium]
MLSNPALPLRTLPRIPASNEQTAWIDLAKQACSESLQLTDALLTTPSTADRDIHSCLVAIRASLELVINEPLSAAQIAVTVRRALQVFDRLACVPSTDRLTGMQSQMA